VDAYDDAPESFAIDLGGGARTTGLAYRAAGSAAERPALLVLAHGAGADQRHRFMVDAARGLARRGVDVVTFNFAYTEQKKRRPDPGPVLEAAWRAALEAARGRARGALFIGGKSMGGRIATQVAARGLPGAPGVAGIVLLGYPLHPPAKPEQLRDGHLPQVEAPMLFVQGERDAFGTPGEMEPVVARCRAATMLVVPHADHGFAVPKRSGKSASDVLDAMLDEVARWMRGTSGRSSAQGDPLRTPRTPRESAR
jgi:hypothetical protein